MQATVSIDLSDEQRERIERHGSLMLADGVDRDEVKRWVREQVGKAVKVQSERPREPLIPRGWADRIVEIDAQASNGLAGSGSLTHYRLAPLSRQIERSQA